MARRLPVAFTALIACGPNESAPDAVVTSEPDAASPSDPLAVVTINTRCLIDDWDARLPLLADGIVAADADVIGLQEVCSLPGGRDALEELVLALAARGAGQYAFTRTTTHLAWDMYDEGLAIVSRHPLGEVRVAPLPAGAIPRKLLAARVMTASGPRVFAVTHLDHQSSSTRGAQAQMVASTLDAFAAGVPSVLVGDLNEAPGGNVTSALELAGFSDAWMAANAAGVGFTFPASAPTVRIDYVWTRGAELAATTADRILMQPQGAVYASDHYGVRAVLGE
jgi:endonuclease/exonuclease/phosphatase family metal-dependent hydrolase